MEPLAVEILMYKPLPQITEALEDLEAQRKRTRDPQRRQRLHLLVLLRAGEVQNRQEAATHLAVHRNTIARWLTAYQRGGLAQLLTVEAPGAKPEQRTLSPAVLEILQERLAGEGFSSYGEPGIAGTSAQYPPSSASCTTTWSFMEPPPGCISRVPLAKERCIIPFILIVSA